VAFPIPVRTAFRRARARPAGADRLRRRWWRAGRGCVTAAARRGAAGRRARRCERRPASGPAWPGRSRQHGRRRSRAPRAHAGADRLL